MKSFITAILALVIVACGPGPNVAQRGKVRLSFTHAVTCTGTPFKADKDRNPGTVNIGANQDFKLLGLGDEAVVCKSDGDNTVTFRNVEDDIVKSYKVPGKTSFWIDPDGLREVEQVTVSAEEANVVSGFSVDLTTSTTVAEKLVCKPDCTYASSDNLFAVNKPASMVDLLSGKDNLITPFFNNGTGSNLQPVLVNGTMAADKAVYVLAKGPKECANNVPVRLDTYFEDADGQHLAYRINELCQVVGSGAKKIVFTTTGGNGDGNGGNNGGNGTVPPPPLVCSGNLCYQSHDPVIVTPYLTDLALMPSMQLELNYAPQGSAPLASDSARPAGQVMKYSVTSDGTGKGHWLAQVYWDLGDLVVGSQQSVSFCYKSTVTQTLFAEALEKNASHQFANAGVWIEVALTAGQYSCQTVQFTVRGDPNKVPTTVTTLSNVKFAFYFGGSKVADVFVDR